VAAAIEVVGEGTVYDNKGCVRSERRAGVGSEIVCIKEWLLLHHAGTFAYRHQRGKTHKGR
jgi:hypothetical protein